MLERLDAILASQEQPGTSVHHERCWLKEQVRRDATKLNLGLWPLERLLQEREAQAQETLAWDRNARGELEADLGHERRFVIFQNKEGFGLIAVWNYYGCRVIKARAPAAEPLKELAQSIVRQGGPFGGPDPEQSARLSFDWDGWRCIDHLAIRAGSSGEFVIDRGYPRRRTDVDHELVVVYRDGTFAIVARGTDRNLMPLGDKLASDKLLPDRLPPMTVRIGDLSLPWTHLGRAFFLGIIPTPVTDVVLLSLPGGVYGIVCSQGEREWFPLAARQIDTIQKFDLGPVLAEIMGRHALESWLRLAGHAPPRPVGADVPSSAPAPQPSAAPAPRSGGGVETSPESSTESRSPPPSARPAPAKPKSPPIDCERVVMHHLKSFVEAIPNGQDGSATARVLMTGIAYGFEHGWASIEGTWKEVFGAFVKSGHFDNLPSDKTARTTFGVVKASPVYRRIDTQHHRICFDECRDPNSDVFQALLREYLERTR